MVHIIVCCFLTSPFAYVYIFFIEKNAWKNYDLLIFRSNIKYKDMFAKNLFNNYRYSTAFISKVSKRCNFVFYQLKIIFIFKCMLPKTQTKSSDNWSNNQKLPMMAGFC